MGRVEHEHVNARIDKRAGTVEHVIRDADGGSAEQTAGCVLCGVRVLEHLFNVLYRDKAAQLVVLVDYGKLLYTVLLEDGLGFVKRRADKAGDKPGLGHDLVDAAAHIGLKLHIAVRDDADELAVFVNDGHAGDAELCHERVRVAEGIAGAEVERICNNAVFGTLDQIDLLGLMLNAHVLMDNADAALSRNCDRHAVLGNGIHGRAHHGHVEPDLIGEPCSKLNIGRQNVTLGRDKKHVIKREPLTDETAAVQILKTHMILPLFLFFAILPDSAVKSRRLFPVAAGVVEYVLLGKTGVFAEHCGIKVLGEVLLERAPYPHVYRESFEVVQSEEHDTVCDLRPYPLLAHEPRTCADAVAAYQCLKVEASVRDGLRC